MGRFWWKSCQVHKIMPSGWRAGGCLKWLPSPWASPRWLRSYCMREPSRSWFSSGQRLGDWWQWLTTRLELKGWKSFGGICWLIRWSAGLRLRIGRKRSLGLAASGSWRWMRCFGTSRSDIRRRLGWQLVQGANLNQRRRPLLKLIFLEGMRLSRFQRKTRMLVKDKPTRTSAWQRRRSGRSRKTSWRSSGHSRVAAWTRRPAKVRAKGNRRTKLVRRFVSLGPRM